MTQFEVIYEAFLGKMLDDEWECWPVELRDKDFFILLNAAIVWFKFPRISLEYTQEGFTETLTNDEIQIIATYMKCEWLNRTILTWENVKPLYDERDFSQANLIAKFNEMLNSEKKNAKVLEANYYRSINNKPFDYRRLAEQ